MESGTGEQVQGRMVRVPAIGRKERGNGRPFEGDSLVDQPVRGLFPAQYVLRRPTRGALAAHTRSFEMPRFRIGQFSRYFFRLDLDCGMGYMNLSLLEKACVLLILQSIAFLKD